MIEKIKTQHILSNCHQCGVTVVCYVCGNNCCSGGSGMIDGKQCTNCLDAYRVQDAYFKDPESVEFSSPPVKDRHWHHDPNWKENLRAAIKKWPEHLRPKTTEEENEIIETIKPLGTWVGSEPWLDRKAKGLV